MTFLNYQGQGYISTLTHDAFVGTLEFYPTAGTDAVTSPTTVKVKLGTNSNDANDGGLVANDWKASDWAALTQYDSAAGNGIEYT
jgi:hypothetical protein